MKSSLRALGWLAALVALGLTAGCSRSVEGAAPSPASEAAPARAPAPAPPPLAPPSSEVGAPQEPTTLADAEALLEKARAELDALALNDLPASASAGAAAPSAPESPGAASPAPVLPQSQTRRAEKGAAQDDTDASRAKGTNRCETACKAFSSLVRASDAVCRLDTDGGKRCERARRVREDAQLRVAGCGCPK